MTIDFNERSAKEYIRSALTSLGSVGAVPLRGRSQSREAVALGAAFMEIELDRRESGAFALVGLMVNGRLPDGYYVDSQGDRVRWHLIEVLHAIGRHDLAKRMRECQKLSAATAIWKQIDIFVAAASETASEWPEAIHRLQSIGPADDSAPR